MFRFLTPFFGSDIFEDGSLVIACPFSIVRLNCMTTGYKFCI